MLIHNLKHSEQTPDCVQYRHTQHCVCGAGAVPIFSRIKSVVVVAAVHVHQLLVHSTPPNQSPCSLLHRQRHEHFRSADVYFHRACRTYVNLFGDYVVVHMRMFVVLPCSIGSNSGRVGSLASCWSDVEALVPLWQDVIALDVQPRECDRTLVASTTYAQTYGFRSSQRRRHVCCQRP